MGYGSINPTQNHRGGLASLDQSTAMQTSMRVSLLWPGLYQEKDQSTACSMDQCGVLGERDALQEGLRRTSLLHLAFPVGREVPGWIEAVTSTRMCQDHP